MKLTSTGLLNLALSGVTPVAEVLAAPEAPNT